MLSVPKPNNIYLLASKVQVCTEIKIWTLEFPFFIPSLYLILPFFAGYLLAKLSF